MSGATIGGIVGGVVGAFFGYPQLGYALGSLIGGAISPEKIQMPSLGDAQQQTSQDGVPIPVVYGTPPGFFGNLIGGDNKARKYRVKQKQDGKGGPEVYQDKFLITVAVGICEGPIAGVAWVKRNGELVYDIRPGSQVPAETRAFMSKARFYLGTEDQLPDPALEAIHGVGNTCYHRGLAYMVIVDDDVTETRGSVARFEFGVVKVGETQTNTETEIIVPRLSRFANGGPLADPNGYYDYRCYWISKDGDIQSPWFENILLARLWFEQQTGLTAPTNYIGYSANTQGWVGNALSIGVETIYPVFDQEDIEPFESVTMAFQFENASQYYQAAITDLCPLGGNWVGAGNGVIAKKMTFEEADAFPYVAAINCSSFGDSGWMGALYPMCLQARRRPVQPANIYGDPCDIDEPVLLPDAPGMTIDCDGVIQPTLNYAVPLEPYLVLVGEQVDNSSGNLLIVREEQGPAISQSDPRYLDEAYWTAAYADAVLNGNAPPGWIYGVDYPKTGTRGLSATVTTTVIEEGEIFLSEVIEDLADRCDVPLYAIDAASLDDDPIPGYLVAVAATGADASRPLQDVFFFDMPEEDGRIVCRERGGEVVGELIDDDSVDTDNDDDDVRSQQIEYPKKVNLVYPDPEANYAPTKQTFFREAYDIHSVDEITITTPVPFDKDMAAQRVDIMGKIAWAKAEGRQKRVMPIDYALWTPGDCYTNNGKRWLLERQEVQDGEVILESSYDRRSAYQSIATGASARPPALPTSGMRGPTQLEVVDVSPLLDAHDQLGVYLPVSYILEGWQGAIIWGSIDGGVTRTQLGIFDTPSIIGKLTTALEASNPYAFDPYESFTVNLHGGDPEGTTFLQILNEANAAIVEDEIIQYQNVEELDPRTFVLSGLTRERNGTKLAPHDAGSRFVVLDALNFVPIQSSWIGRVVTYRVYSLNTPIETWYQENHVFMGNSQREWTPVGFNTVELADRYVISWNGRARLGSSDSPFHSSFFDGYRVRIAGGGIIRTYSTSDQFIDLAKIERTSAWGGITPLTVEVFALNRITGESEPLTGTLV